MEELSKEYGNKILFAKVNVDIHRAKAAEFGIMSIPTLPFFSEGKLVGTCRGSFEEGARTED